MSSAPAQTQSPPLLTTVWRRFCSNAAKFVKIKVNWGVNLSRKMFTWWQNESKWRQQGKKQLRNKTECRQLPAFDKAVTSKLLLLSRACICPNGMIGNPYEFHVLLFAQLGKRLETSTFENEFCQIRSDLPTFCARLLFYLKLTRGNDCH